MFVQSDSNAHGPGTVLRKGQTPGHLVVEYFDTPQRQDEDPIQVEVPLDSSFKPYGVAPETRVFWKSPHEGFPRWKSGRVANVADDDLVVRAKPRPVVISREDAYIRWHEDLNDPLGFACVGVLESPHNAERRVPYLKAVEKQRAACRGLTGLLSTSVELHAHQLRTAQRVLEDHTQRYLLADEVGLGKTIETILIIRQLMIENPTLTVQLVLPPHLARQWRHEIEAKLHPEHFPESTVRYGSHDDPESWHSADIIIVDEAHHLAASATSGGPVGRARYDRLRDVASASPRLLLLSATPALHNEQAFLAMLHVLEPSLYRLDDVAGLRRRLETRRPLGRALLQLTPDTPPFLLPRIVEGLRSHLAGDADLLPLLDAITTADDEQRRGLIIALRERINDRYQVHRRMVRTRRTDALVDSFPVAGRRGVTDAEIDPSGWFTLESFLESCRDRLAIGVEEGTVSTEQAARLMAAVVEAGPDSHALVELADNADGVLPAIRAQDTGADEALEAIADALTLGVAHGERVVLFTSSASLASRLAAVLAQFCGADTLRTLTADMSDDEIDDAVTALRDGPCQWLVVDPTAEEGMNLQFADVMVHVGLPASANRLEQRIGRLDRWSDQAGTWRSLQAAPLNGIARRWATVLRDGFKVHDRSIAAVQRAVEELTWRTWSELLPFDADVERVCADIDTALEAETQAIREQDAIDAASDRTLRTSFVEDVLATDRESDSTFGDAFHQLIAQDGSSGNLRFLSRRGRTGTTYEIGDPSKGQNMPLVPMNRLHEEFQHALGHEWTGSREVSTRSGTGLLRAGSPLVDAAERFLRHDDRGRAWGMWRWIDAEDVPEGIWMRFDMRVHANHATLRRELNEIKGDIDRGAIWRRLSIALHETTVTRWISSDGEVPSDTLRAVLDRPYTKAVIPGRGRDFNLSGTRMAAVADVLPASRWSSVLREAERTVVKEQLDGEALTDRLLEARVMVERGTAARVFVLQGQHAAGQLAEDAMQREIDLEEHIGRALLTTFSTPVVSVDSLGLIIVAAHNPFTGEVDVG